MDTVTKNASGLFIERLTSLDPGEHGNWRCIYCNFSDTTQLYNRALRTHFIVPTMAQLLEDVEGSIYVWDDGDVFLMFEAPMEEVVDRLAPQFESIIPEGPGRQPSESMFTLFELGRHWPVLMRLCRAKFASRTRARTAASQPMRQPERLPAAIEG